MNRWMMLPCALFLTYFASCSQEGHSGTTMETENSVAMQVLDSVGEPVAGVRAILRPLWYVADSEANGSFDSSSIRELTADSHGWIRCDGLPKGGYRIEVGKDSLAAGFEFNLADTLSAKSYGSLWLAKAGSLKGRVPLPVGVKQASVQVYGSEHATLTDSNGNFELNGLPQGLVRVRAYTASEPSVLADDLALVHSGTDVMMGTLAAPIVVNEDHLTWRFSRILHADSLVYDWMRPLSDTTVLTIRLDSNSFDFSQALADGRDLRIEDQTGRPLVHERVLWDTALGRAVVRVRMVTTGLDSNTTILMRWGHQGALALGSAGLWDGVPDSLHRDFTVLTLGDFEKGVAKSDLPYPLPATYWYFVASDSAMIDNNLLSNFTNSLQPAGLGRTGYAVHLSYQATPPHWVLIGTGLGPEPHCLAALDSVVFWARGEGQLSFALDNLSGPGTKAWVHLPLDTTWTRYSVTPKDFLPAQEGTFNVGWDGLRDSVTNITFLINNGNNLWLDGVTLFGIGIDDLLPNQ